jgi:hypothetical protein
LKICEGQASAVASMIRVDGMIGEVLAACIPGTVLCLMVIPLSLSLNWGME